MDKEKIDCKSSAFISADDRYRYGLLRRWGEVGDYICFVGLNPSTADAEKNDPTIRRCMAFAKAWGYSEIYVVNLFAFRATDPRQMRHAVDPIGPLNMHWVGTMARGAEMVIACWGRGGSFLQRDDFMQKYLVRLGVKLFCLGLTKDGFPKHPLARGKHRIPNDARPQPFPF